MTDQRYVLKARGLSKRFGEGETIVEAVRGVNLMLGPGEIVLMMGLSGTGKTTLLSMLGALLRPTDGDLRLVDVWLNELTERELPALRANRIGFIFQDFNLMPSLTARENVEVALNVAGVHGAEAHERATRLLEELGLAERLDFLPEKLSGGEKQRVRTRVARPASPPAASRGGGCPGRPRSIAGRRRGASADGRQRAAALDVRDERLGGLGEQPVALHEVVGESVQLRPRLARSEVAREVLTEEEGVGGVAHDLLLGGPQLARR
jgi:putative ABC transport system ATP-binding protein